jgi:putative hydrolase of the HAD superfamily
MSQPPIPAHARPGPRHRLRALLFDAGNTLLRMNYAAIAEHLRGRGRSVSEREVEEAEVRARVRLDPHLGPHASTESQDAHGLYLRYLLEHVGVTGDTEVDAMLSWRRSYNLPVGLWNVPDPEAGHALRRARAAGLAVGVISNSNGSARSILEATGLAADLDFVIDSGVVGVEKPDPRIFRLGLAAAGVEAHEAVYVGDLYSVDVLGARAAGIAGVLLDPRGLWAPRDCVLAPGVLEAVRLALDGAGA